MLEIRGDVREGLVPSSELESSAGDSNKIYYLVRKYCSTLLPLPIGADDLSQIPKSTCQTCLLLFPHKALLFSINLGFDVCLISLDVRCIDAFYAAPHNPPSVTPLLMQILPSPSDHSPTLAKS